MDKKVIIVKKKKKTKSKSKPKKVKSKPKATMEQKVSQNVKIIINERAKPQRRKNLAVRGFNTPRLTYQPPTIINRGLDSQGALDSFRNIYDTRVRAIEQGLNGVSGNIVNLTSQLQNNRNPPLHTTPIQSSTTSVMSDEEGQRLLDERMAANIQLNEIARKTQIEKDYYNSSAGKRDGIYNNFIGSNITNRAAEDFYGGQSNPALLDPTPNLPEAEARFDPSVPEAQVEEKVEQAQAEAMKKIRIARQKFSPEERKARRETRIEIQGDKSLEFTEEAIRNADEDGLVGMLSLLESNDGLNFIDGVSGGITRGQIGNARNFIRNTVRENKKQRQAKEQALKGGKNFGTNFNRNL